MQRTSIKQSILQSGVKVTYSDRNVFKSIFISLHHLNMKVALKPLKLLTSSNTVRIICTFYLWITLSSNIFSQEVINRQSVYVDAFGLEEGLRQSMVSCIYQDKTGLIWAASGDGLHCFDGKRFMAFRIPYKGTFHHSDNMMRMMTGTASGNFMISSSSSLFQFNPANSEFKFINREVTVYVVLLNVEVNGCSLAWTLNKGLCLADSDSLYAMRLKFPHGMAPPEEFRPTNAVRFDQNRVLILGEEGIIHLTAGTKPSTTSSQSDRLYQATWEPLPGCKALARDNQGNVYIINRTTIYKYISKGKWQPLLNTGIDPGMVFFADHKQNFWFTDISNHNLYKLSQNRLTKIVLLNNSGRETDTIRTNIKYIFEDKSNNVWFGTDGSGLLKYSPDKVMFNKALIGFTRCLTSVNNEVFAGTYNNGLWKLSHDLSQYKRINPEVFDNNEYILDLTTDKFNRIWAVSRKGLYVLTGEGKAIYSYPGECITAKFIYSDSGRIELYSDTKLFTFNAGETPGFLKKTNQYEIRSFITEFNKKWIATQAGIYFLDKLGFKNQTPPGTLISGSEAFGLIRVNNEVWAATGNGIEVFSKEGQSINTSAVTQLLNEAIYSLLPDDEGRIWFIGLSGIGFIDAQKQRVIRFKPENNLQSLEFNQNAVCITQNGTFCFGGINGVNSIVPADLGNQGKTPEIRIFTLMVSDTVYSAGVIPSFKHIELDRTMASIEGSVFATNYGGSGHSGFSFCLEGYESKWSTPSTDATFSYRNLQPGNYRLFVKYTDILKNEGPPQLILTIHIAPAFWQRPIFYVLVVLFIIMATILIVRRVQSIRYLNRIKELEREQAIERERSRISKDMHDEVGASLTRISILTELAKKEQAESNKATEIIDKISVIAGNVVDELSEIIWAMNPKNDNLETFAAYVRSYAGNYLESTGINIRFEFPDLIPSLPMTAEYRRNLFLIIKEALNNIVKHSEAENVLLRLQIEESMLKITVQDDGKGMDTDNQKTEKSPQVKGNGLWNMQTRATETGADFKLVSGEKGTQIMLVISLAGIAKSH